MALAAAASVLLAILVSFCFSEKPVSSTEYSFDLSETGGVGGFLSQFLLDYESLLSTREITLPSKDDAIFADYGKFLSDFGMDVLNFSGKRVEERYLKLKNKAKKGQSLYAVVYIYKEKLIAAHLTTLEFDSEILPITAFV